MPDQRFSAINETTSETLERINETDKSSLYHLVESHAKIGRALLERLVAQYGFEKAMELLMSAGLNLRASITIGVDSNIEETYELILMRLTGFDFTGEKTSNTNMAISLRNTKITVPKDSDIQPFLPEFEIPSDEFVVEGKGSFAVSMRYSSQNSLATEGELLVSFRARVEQDKEMIYEGINIFGEEVPPFKPGYLPYPHYAFLYREPDPRREVDSLILVANILSDPEGLWEITTFEEDVDEED